MKTKISIITSLLICFLISITATAQQKASNLIIKSSYKYYNTQKFVQDKSAFNKSNINTKATKGNKGSNIIKISSSDNVYTLIVPESRCLSANQATNTIMFIHRADPTKGLGTSSGNIVASKSIDGGATWKQIMLTADTKKNRYPSGDIFNPTGNTDPSKAYAIFSGTATNDIDWTDNCTGSARLDSTHFDVQYTSVASFKQEFPRVGFTTCNDSSAHVLGDQMTLNTAGDITQFPYLVMNNGHFDANTLKFTWTKVKQHISLAKDKTNAIALGVWNTAWSQDGKIGYMYVTGRDSVNDKKAFQPIVYKSVDKGKTWTKQTAFDFSTITTLKNQLWALADNFKKVVPEFLAESQGIVDANGKLHIIGLVEGKVSIQDDSLNLSFASQPYRIYDTYMTASGWDAELIDTIRTTPVKPSDAGFGTGDDATGWDHRIQTSRTSDGKKIFVVWSDTDLKWGIDNNVAPDIKIWGKDITTGWRTSVKNITAGTSLEGSGYWHYAAQTTLVNNGKYKIPVTISPIFGSYTNSPLTSISHYFLQGAEFSDAEFGCGFKTKTDKTKDLCKGGSVNLQSSGGTIYKWNTGATTANITVSPSVTTTYSVEVSQNAYCKITDQVVVTVHDLPIANVSGNNNICAGDSTLLTATGGISYKWSTNAINDVIRVKPSVNTTYTVTVTDQNGCIQTDLKSINVNPVLVLTMPKDSAITSGASVKLLTNVSGGTQPYQYQWTPANFLDQSNILSPTVQATTATRVYTLTVTDTKGCTIQKQTTVIVDSLPWVKTSEDQTICQGDSIKLLATSGPKINNTYQWSSTSSLNDANLASPIATPTVTTTYIVTVSDASMNSYVDQVIITVHSAPMINAGMDTAVCIGSSINLSATANSGSAAILSKIWLPNTNLTSGNTLTPTVNPSVPTTYTLMVTDEYACAASSSVIVGVNSLPSAPSIKQVDDTLFSTPGNSYQWFFDDSPINSATADRVETIANGSYTVVISDNHGCQAESLPFQLSVGIHNIEINEHTELFNTFPNPSTGEVNIQFNKAIAGHLEIKILNSLGMVIQNQSYENIGEKSLLQFNLSEQAKGLYFAVINTGSVTQVSKIVLQ